MAEDEQHPANKNRTVGIADFIGAVFSKIISLYREFCLSSSTNLSQINDNCKIPSTGNGTRDNENLRSNYNKDDNLSVVSSIINDYGEDAPQPLNLSQQLWMSSHLDENIESMPAVDSQVYLKVNKENNDKSLFSDLGLDMVTVNQLADSQTPADGIFVADISEQEANGFHQ